MTAPLISLTNECCKRSNLSDNKVLLSTLAFDALVSITALVVGILGATSVIAMPAAAAYSLIGLSGGITLLWIIGIAKNTLCKNWQFPCFHEYAELRSFVPL